MKNNILNRIRHPEDLKKLNICELEKLASELRELLIEKISIAGR